MILVASWQQQAVRQPAHPGGAVTARTLLRPPAIDAKGAAARCRLRCSCRRLALMFCTTPATACRPAEDRGKRGSQVARGQRWGGRHSSARASLQMHVIEVHLPWAACWPDRSIGTPGFVATTSRLALCSVACNGSM